MNLYAINIEHLLHSQNARVATRRNRGDICVRCTKIALAHSFFAIFDFVIRRANLYSKDVEVFRIVIHWFFKVKKVLLEGVH